MSISIVLPQPKHNKVMQKKFLNARVNPPNPSNIEKLPFFYFINQIFVILVFILKP